MSTTTKVPQFAEGELVNVTIRGAQVANTYPTSRNGVDTGTVLVADYPGRGDLGFAVNLAASGVTVERVAPAEWPPQIGDIWADRDDREWFATSDTALVSSGLAEAHAGAFTALENYGPMRLVRRRGWAPADTAPVEATPERVDRRTQFITGLRALVDLLELCPALQVGYVGSIGWIVDGDEQLRAWAEALGAEIDRHPDKNGTMHNTVRGRLGGIGIEPFYLTAPEPDEPVEDDQADTDPEAPVPAPAETFRCAWIGGCSAEVEAPGEICDDGHGLPHRVPDADAESLLADTLADGVS